jgi:ligand-binding sensor domain-containing protein/signal transduction histidine kinase
MVRWFGLAALLLVTGQWAMALDPKQSLRDVGHQIWLTENGLPQNTVQSITQTRDGYIWIGTQEGLARFDGLKFVIFDKENTPQFKSNDIRSLLEDREGALWISTSYGLLRLQNGQFTAFTANEGLPDNSVGQIAQDRGGNLWIVTSAGLARYRNGSFRTYTASDGLASNVIQTLFARPDGSLLIVTPAGIEVWVDEKITQWPTPEELKTAGITSIEEDVTGRLLFGTLDGLFEFNGGKTTAHSANQGLPNSRISSLHIDREGSLWIGTAGGVARFRDGRLDSFTSAIGLSSNLILSIFEDREGSVWIGTEAGGLNLLKSKKFTTFTAKDGLPSDLVKTIYQDPSGAIWIGTNGGGLALLKDGKFQTVTTREGLSSDVVFSLAGDGVGGLWVGTPDGLNLLKGGRFKTFTFADGLANDLVRSVYMDRSGNLWVGTRDGLTRFKDGRFTTYTTHDGLANNFIGALYEDSKGNLWIGTLGGLSKFKDERFTSFTTNDGLSSNTVICFYEDAEGDLWIGTSGGGLDRLRGEKFVSFTSGNGLPDDVIYRVLEDGQRNLWLSSSKGIFRLSKRELESFANHRIAALSPVLYGPADGMLTRECSGGGHPAAWKTTDGKLWFATIKGIAVIDPENIATNSLPPPLAIEQVRVDNQTVPWGPRIEAPAGSSRFDFYYTALSFIAPENVRFKYKLEGFDQDWIDGGPQRVAYYTNLRPGNYRFRVIAANNDGVWNEQGAAFELYLRPHFYQTYWFYALGALLLAAIAWEIYRLRLRQVASQFGAVLAERNRIAREIHDNLAQDVLGISVQLELVARLMPAAAEKAKSHLDQARILVRNTMNEARRYVWDLRSQELEKRDLPAVLSEVARRLTRDRAVHAQVQVTGAFRPLPDVIENNLLRIGQEAINNAVNHAQAQRILIDLKFDAQRVQLSIRDDGRGFDPQAESFDGRFGLIGMRERAEQIGGSLTIHSENGSGTEVIISVPVSVTEPGAVATGS